MRGGILQRQIAERLAQREELGGAVLELAEGGNLASVMSDLGAIMEASRDGASALVLIGIEHVGAPANFGAVLTDALDELLGDGTAADLIEVFDLLEERAALEVKLGYGRRR